LFVVTSGHQKNDYRKDRKHLMNAPMSQNFDSSLIRIECPNGAPGRQVAFLGARASHTLRGWSDQNSFHVTSLKKGDLAHFGSAFSARLKDAAGNEKIGSLFFSLSEDRLGTVVALSIIKRYLADGAAVVIENADFTSVYDGIREVLVGEPHYRFNSLELLGNNGSRAGQGIAILSFSTSNIETQDPKTIPASKNKVRADAFVPAEPVQDYDSAEETVKHAIAKPINLTPARSKEISEILEEEFPDVASSQEYWHQNADDGFLDFFTWGHDQDFGNGFSRKGAMATRHEEILSECVQYGYLPEDLTGMKVLDIGCWTGGDVIGLVGMGAEVKAIEEHKGSAAAAKRLCQLLDVPAKIMTRSLYKPVPAWRQKFDIVYISGVIYHVTDPVLALRICFSYLKPGGRIIVETKASGLEGPSCEYCGTAEKGWNWYAPTLETMGRWLLDAGFERDDIHVHMRPVERLLAMAVKNETKELPERAGFSRPDSWLEEET
jgi:2-polyprenyl-3-methyl-5-hydroxy-6-metoxy-1,4-benzoquinol methylase